MPLVVVGFFSVSGFHSLSHTRACVTHASRARSRLLFHRHDSIRLSICLTLNGTVENTENTVLSLQILENGFVLNPYDEVDEDLLRELRG